MTSNMTITRPTQHLEEKHTTVIIHKQKRESNPTKSGLTIKTFGSEQSCTDRSFEYHRIPRI